MLIIITVHIILFLLWLLLLPPLVDFTVSLCEFCFCRIIWKRFFAALGVEHAQHRLDQFRFRRVDFYSQLNLRLATPSSMSQTYVLVNLNINDARIVSHTHSPLPLTNISDHIHFPLLRYPIPTLYYCVRGFTSPIFRF